MLYVLLRLKHNQAIDPETVRIEENNRVSDKGWKRSLRDIIIGYNPDLYSAIDSWEGVFSLTQKLSYTQNKWDFIITAI